MTAMNNTDLADLLYPDITLTPADMRAKYPPRNLLAGAAVTRFAPSPTGYVHFGNLFPTTTSERLAHQSGGVFYLRIEDTDAKREVKGAVEDCITTLARYGIVFDEGATIDGDSGAYGPYRQRQREGIYKVYAKWLVQQGRAYPCFCSEEELEQAHAKQEALKANFGYFGEWAVCSGLNFADIENKIQQGKPFVLRFRSMGNPAQKDTVTDLVRGKLEFPQNDVDHVLLKSDGIPTYHFAHAVDDYLMGTTHVVRGDEWLATLPLHVQLFDALGHPRLNYLHISPLMKMDGESKRKLSKRKDPEVSLSFYESNGYPLQAVREYVMTLLNSNYEEWRTANPLDKMQDFPFSTDKMSISGALFDIVKLADVSKSIISRLDSHSVYTLVTEWSRSYDEQLHGLLTADPAKAEAIFAIGRGGDKPRKDIAKWDEVRAYIGFMYDELFQPDYTLPETIPAGECRTILTQYRAGYQPAGSSDEWFARVRELASANGYAAQTKDFKKNPGAYKGHVGDVSMMIRIAVSGRQNSPDLYSILQILGKDKVLQRLDRMVAAL